MSIQTEESYHQCGLCKVTITPVVSKNIVNNEELAGLKLLFEGLVDLQVKLKILPDQKEIKQYKMMAYFADLYVVVDDKE